MQFVLWDIHMHAVHLKKLSNLYNKTMNEINYFKIRGSLKQGCIA